MRFLPTILLSYLVLGIQSGLTPYIGIRNATPNLMVPVVVFIALYAPREPALIGVFILGLMQDVLSQDPLGVHALVCAAVAAATRITQPAIHREHWLTHLVLGLIGGALQGLVLWLVGLRMPPRPSFDVLAYSAIYTAVLTPILLKGLISIRKVFAFQPERKTVGKI